MDRIVIIGMGLIGGSVGLALKAAQLNNMEIVGVDHSWEAVNLAKKRGAIDRFEQSPADAARDAQIVIVATPLLAMPEVFKELAPVLPNGAIVTDTGSTKAQVMAWASEHLPETVSFVGGHPMAGKETPGIEGATADLFKDATYCVIPSLTAANPAVEVVVGLAGILGAKHLFIEAVEHDVLVGGISHLPLVLSAALVSATSASPSWSEMGKLASSGFRDVSRLASGNPDLAEGVSQTNQASLLKWLDSYMDVLTRYRKLLAEDNEGFLAEIAAARDARNQWVLQKTEGDQEGERMDLPSPAEHMTEMLVGGRIAEFMRRQDERLSDADKRGPRR